MKEKRPKPFTVEGRGAFPVDMLRYDSCYPTDTNSAMSILVSREYGDEYRNVRRIKLATYGFITPARWASFNWQVIES